MTHFTVLVIGDNVEDQLAPYDENLNNNFCDCTDEVKKEYNNKVVSRVVLKNGQEIFKWSSHNEEDVIETKKVHVSEIYPTIEEFVDYYQMYEKVGDKFGYFHNNKAKWDWYLIGGRWTGAFKLKDNVPTSVGNIGEPGIMTSPAKEGFCDQSPKKYIDLEWMRNNKEREAATKYDTVYAAIGNFDNFVNWETVRDKMFPNDLTKAREFYNNQSQVKLTSKLIGFFENVDSYNIPREEYLKRARDSAISTFAVVKDGQWFEKGEMGWWAVVINEMEQQEWNTKFNELLNSIPDDTLLTMVDCHI